MAGASGGAEALQPAAATSPRVAGVLRDDAPERQRPRPCRARAGRTCRPVDHAGLRGDPFLRSSVGGRGARPSARGTGGGAACIAPRHAGHGTGTAAAGAGPAAGARTWERVGNGPDRGRVGGRVERSGFVVLSLTYR